MFLKTLSRSKKVAVSNFQWTTDILEFHLEEATDENFVIGVKVGIYDDQGNSTSLETEALLSVNGAKRYVYFSNRSMDAGQSGKPVLEMMLIGLEDL